MGKWGLALVLASALVGPVRAAESFEMDVVETDDVRMLYFDPIQTYLVPHMSRSYHNSIEFQKEIFGWQPWDKPTVVLTDLSDYGNAGAAVSPGNGVTVYIAPSNRTLETLPGTERTFMLMNHELVHISTMDAWNEQDAFWRRLFMGKPRQSDSHPESILYNYLTVPRMSSPRWFQEGAATFLETWMSGGVGRAQGAYDEMVFRAMVRDGAHFYSNLGIVSEGVGVDFQVGVNAYLYGTRFISYLAYEYSPEQLIEWLSRPEGSERYYWDAFRQVFGLDLEDAWDDWIAFEKRFQQANLERVREEPLTPTRPLVDQALGSISRAFLSDDESTLVAAFRYPGVVAHVGTLDMDTGAYRRVTDIKGPKVFPVTSPAYDPDSHQLFYTADNNAYRDLMVVDLASGKRRMLLEDARIGDIAYNRQDRSLWGIRHLNGYVSLVRVPYPYTDFNEIHTWPYGQVVYELDVSHDGTLVSFSKAEIDGTQSLQIHEIQRLLDGEVAPKHEISFGPSVPEGFVFSHDDRFLIGTSFITGVSNVLRYEPATGELEALSNAETGFFRPLPRRDGSLVVFEYTGQGFIPSVIDGEVVEDLSAITFLGNEIVKAHPSIKDWSVIPSLREVDHEELITHEGKYRPYRELELGSAYPVVEGYRDDTALGMHFNFADPAGFNRFTTTASYSVNEGAESDERLHVELDYQALNWRLRYWHNNADFYDLFGPTERGRKGDAFLIGYEKALIFDEPRELTFSADVAYFDGLDSLPLNQNIGTFGFEDILAAQVGLEYSHERRSLGAVDHEKGIRWELVGNADHSEGETVYRARADLDAGLALPWKHSSLWLYNSMGVSYGDDDNPLTGFFFGGFKNNYVDDGDEKRYREYNSMPGFEIDKIGGQSYAKSILEWNLPPIRFREVGKPALFLSWVRPALFAGTLWTDPDKDTDARTHTVGAQVDLHFTLAHRLPMTLSAGYAAGLGSGPNDSSEWLLSLKIL